jgi:hypothetical protein
MRPLALLLVCYSVQLWSAPILLKPISFSDDLKSYFIAKETYRVLSWRLFNPSPARLTEVHVLEVEVEFAQRSGDSCLGPVFVTAPELSNLVAFQKTLEETKEKKGEGQKLLIMGSDLSRFARACGSVLNFV